MLGAELFEDALGLFGLFVALGLSGFELLAEMAADLVADLDADFLDPVEGADEEADGGRLGLLGDFDDFVFRFFLFFPGHDIVPFRSLVIVYRKCTAFVRGCQGGILDFNLRYNSRVALMSETASCAVISMP